MPLVTINDSNMATTCGKNVYLRTYPVKLLEHNFLNYFRRERKKFFWCATLNCRYDVILIFLKLFYDEDPQSGAIQIINFKQKKTTFQWRVDDRIWENLLTWGVSLYTKDYPGKKIYLRSKAIESFGRYAYNSHNVYLLWLQVWQC